ncbi:MAG: hypothetical protein AAF458_12810 [Pseudomonadota bacterium]
MSPMNIPRGVWIVGMVNTVLLAIFGGNLVVFYVEGVTRTLTFVASWIALTGLLVVLFGLLVRGRMWHQLSRIALYTLALAFGVQVLALLPQIGELQSSLAMLGLALVILYVVGARGYISSDIGRRWFGVPPKSDDSGKREPGADDRASGGGADP